MTCEVVSMVNFRSMGPMGFGRASAAPPVSDEGSAQAGASRKIVDEPRSKTEDRAAPRHRFARETATVGFGGKMLTADLINLSGGGAMIEADIDPRMWDRVNLHLGEGNPIECAVRWIRNGRIGLEFAHETQIDCSPKERDALLCEVIRRNFPDTVASPLPLASTAAFDPARRNDRRHPLIWNGEIAWQDASRTVRLRNISASGFLIDAPVDFPEGAEVQLNLGKSGPYAATVRWCRSGQAGLIFKTPFDLSALAAARPVVAPQTWQRPSYLDRCSDQPSPWEKGWERSELSELHSDLAGFLKY